MADKLNYIVKRSGDIWKSFRKVFTKKGAAPIEKLYNTLL